METKRFIGSDMARIFARVRRELGADAVIVSTRSLLREGADPLTEVLAAPPDDEDEGLPLDFQRSIIAHALARLESRPLTVGDLEDIAARQALTELAPEPPARDGEAGQAPPAWLEGFVAAARGAPADGPAFSGEAEPPSIEWARRAFEPSRPTVLRPERFIAPGLDELLTGAGLTPAAAAIITAAAGNERDPARAVAGVLGSRRVAYPEEGRTAIITIEGPTGSGRTTALVRMALDCADSGREAILLAADSTHVAARDQVRSYAEAMGLPVYDAFDERDIARTATRARRGAVIFADVASGPWAPRMSLPASVDRFAYLALPAHWQTGALEMALAPFATASLSGCVLTFTDLVTGLSPVLSTAIESHLGLAFISSGRDVSTGIEAADPLTLASGIFSNRTGDASNGHLVASA